LARSKLLKATEVILLGCLYQLYSDEVECIENITQNELAIRIGKSVQVVNRALKKLEKNNFIRIQKPTGEDLLNHKPNKYFPLFHSIFEDKEFNILPDQN